MILSFLGWLIGLIQMGGNFVEMVGSDGSIH